MIHKTFRRCAPILIGAMLLLPAFVGAQTVEVAGDDEVERHVMVVRSHGDGPHSFGYSMSHRAFLGVNMLDLTPELRRHFGVGEEEGVMISRVEDDSPAAAAGLAAGDILVAVDGDGVGSTMEIVHAIGTREEGDVVDLQVMRDGQLQVFSATLAERQRPKVDISRWAWRTEGEDGAPLLFVCDEDEEDCPELLEIDPELMEDAMSNFEVHLNSPHLKRKMIEFHEGNEELEDRLEELEKHLEELRRQLEELEK